MWQQWPGNFRKVEPGLGNVIGLWSAKLVGRPSAEWSFAARENKSSSLPAATGQISSRANEQVLQKQTSACGFPQQKFRLQVWLLAEGSDCLGLNRIFSVEVAEQLCCSSTGFVDQATLTEKTHRFVLFATKKYFHTTALLYFWNVKSIIFLCLFGNSARYWYPKS